MKKVLFLSVLLLALGVSAQAQNILHLNRYAAENQALPPADGPRVVLFGDSITDAWPDNRPEFFAQNGFLGRGIGGEVTAQMLLRFRADVIDIQASTVVFLAGINDIALNLGGEYNEDATFANIESMVELCWLHGIRPVLCSLLPSYNIRWRPEVTDPLDKIESLNARMKVYCARHGITYVDYHAAMVGPDGRKVRDGITNDTVHPNAEGYAIMEALLLDALR